MKLLILTKRSLVSIGFCMIIGVLAAAVAVTSTVRAVQTAAQPKEIPIYRVQSDKKEVAISFDAAWGNEETGQLLDILDEHDVKATFFLVGDWVDKYPDDVKNIAAHGHDIGNHSDTHPHLPQVVSAVKSLGMYCVQWDVDSLDWKDPSPEQLCQNVLGKVRDGSIVLMHNGAKNTPAALPSIIEGIQNKGYEIVLIKDLIPEGEYYTDVQGEMHLSE